MSTSNHHIGQRLSLKDQTCTVRYVGTVADKAGTWLGVEWDDPSRGKHNGTHDGAVYFTCRSKSPTAGSFVRPSQPWDQPRTFLQALREKYMPDFHEAEADIIYFSGKQAEEIGFGKFHHRQAKLHGIKVLVLDRMRMRHQDDADGSEIEALCAEITDLDLSGNLFETVDEIVDLCSLFPKLRALTLDGNRFSVCPSDPRAFPPGMKSLSLSRTLLTYTEVEWTCRCFGNLETLTLAENEWSGDLSLQLPPTITTLGMAGNKFTSLCDLEHLIAANLHTLILKRNRISSVFEAEDIALNIRVQELDLTHNTVNSLSFFDAITPSIFPNLNHIRTTGNPVYSNLISAEGKPLTSSDGYMLTIARLPQLEYLNYSKITEKERLNAETYYLAQIAIEISKAPKDKETEVTARHPRFKALCEEYGEPAIQRNVEKGEVDPNSLAARLVMITFTLGRDVFLREQQRSWTQEIPKSFTIYALLGIVGKRLQLPPLSLRLILESTESDPVGKDSAYGGPEWWDSDEEIDGEEARWVNREVEMVAGTRTLGTYIETTKVDVRVEMLAGRG